MQNEGLLEIMLVNKDPLSGQYQGKWEEALGGEGTELNLSAQEKWAAVSSACFGITGMCLDRTSQAATCIELHSSVTTVWAVKPALVFAPIFQRDRAI